MYLETKKVWTKNFPDLDSAFVHVMEPDAEHCALIHLVPENGSVRSHVHPNACEVIFLVRGKITMEINWKSRVFDKEGCSGVLVVGLPQNTPHSLKAHTECRYYVLRDQRDETVYI